jgi:hypothetical protein
LSSRFSFLSFSFSFLFESSFLSFLSLSNRLSDDMVTNLANGFEL